MTEPSFLTRTRTAYDAIAVEYAELHRGELGRVPLDMAMLGLFADLVRPLGGPVTDVGCGTGRATGHLAGLGVDVSGVDLSPGMLEVARAAYPDLSFREGSMTGLDLPEASQAGITAVYSIIHVPMELLPGVFAGFRRALVPGGEVMVVFQVGEEPRRMGPVLGHPVELVFHRRTAEQIAALLEEAGLVVHTRVVREPMGDERTPHAHLFARRPLED
ncbi:class I SAM-dependent DNA methyltransferase [Nocardiopsis sp. NPDC101807]|uniref:class I SAM-dependent DNA methyltransferase n=1 Tax=Nocardiopsis sp. NPDC101807 TaxID=3364339 RepID=UPI00380EE6CB